MPSIWTCGCTFKSSQNTGIHLLLILSRKQGWRKTQKKPNSRWRTHLSKSEVRPVADCIRELSCDSLKSYTTRMILNGKISKEKSSHDKIHTVCRCLGSGCCCAGRPEWPHGWGIPAEPHRPSAKSADQRLSVYCILNFSVCCLLQHTFSLFSHPVLQQILQTIVYLRHQTN